MQDEELFTLCKQVRERTNWFADIRIFYADTDVPCYTSDYLLSKLPKRIGTDPDTDYVLYMECESEEWLFTYNDIQNGWGFAKGFERTQLRADTPIKALLKLTLALAEAGEL
jgi:hypothetical protein